MAKIQVQPLVVPGAGTVTGSGNLIISVNLPSWKTIVEKIMIEVTHLSMLVNIIRSDYGAAQLTLGAVAVSMVGGILRGVSARTYEGIRPFRADGNATLTFDLTDFSTDTNLAKLAVHTVPDVGQPLLLYRQTIRK